MRFFTYLNPLERLGKPQYATWFPLLAMIAICILSEFFDYQIVKNPMFVGAYAIYLFTALIIYFAFRDGIKGGIIATTITIVYYGYIVFSRHYSGSAEKTGISTIVILALLYYMIAFLIGWLKQTIDQLILRETEARQLAEEGTARLQTILQQLPVGVLLVGNDGKHVEVNRQFEEIFGNKPTMLQPQNKSALLDGAKYPHYLTEREWPITRALKKGETVIGEVMQYKRADNRIVSLRVSAAPVKNRQKKAIAAVSTIIDITQEKELERRKDDFVNMASHELKTPLTSLKLYLELLIRQWESSEDATSRKMLDNIKVQTDRLQTLVADLLDVSRIQTGKLHLQKASFDLTGLIDEIVVLFQQSTQQRLVFTEKKPCMVQGDRFRIYQVLTNLLTNAIKYSPPDQSIVISMSRLPGKVTVGVQDFGIGIAKDEQKKIFERLYQVSSTDEKKFPGLGMGLYISKEIIHRHKGTIWVEGDLGKGSTFFFRLPTENQPSRARTTHAAA